MTKIINPDMWDFNHSNNAHHLIVISLSLHPKGYRLKPNITYLIYYISRATKNEYWPYYIKFLADWLNNDK